MNSLLSQPPKEVLPPTALQSDERRDDIGHALCLVNSFR